MVNISFKIERILYGVEDILDGMRRIQCSMENILGGIGGVQDCR
jgi:hypothetical protein